MNCVCVLCSWSYSFGRRWMKRLISALISILLISKAWSRAKHSTIPLHLSLIITVSVHTTLFSKGNSENQSGSQSRQVRLGEDLTVMHLLQQNSYFNCTCLETTDHYIRQMYDWFWKKERLKKWVTLIILELPQSQINTSPNTYIPVDESVSSEVKQQVFVWKTLVF